MRATTATTIRGVSILAGHRRPRPDVFDIALSSNGIEIRWPGRPATRMPWDRVSQWEIEERRGGVLLTRHGVGSTTPLVVPGWTLDDLETVMRATAGASPGTAATPATRATQPAGRAAVVAAPAVEAARRTPAVSFRTERRWRIRTPIWSAVSWKVVGTVVLLGLLATAVTLVLLQSAGVISWGFLGPTA